MEASYAASYRELYRNHFWWRAREAMLVELIEQLDFPRDREILDVGCGDGLFFEHLQRFGRVQGVEPDPSLLTAHGPHRAAIHCGAFDRSFQPPQRFSLIVMLDVLEHLDDPRAALTHALSLLEPRGKLLITLPAFDVLWSAHDELNQHRTRYTKASFQQLVAGTALHVERCEYFFHWLFPLKLAGALAERVLGARPKPAAVPGRAFNRVAYAVSRVEQRLLGAHPLPFGSSLLAVGRRE